MSVKTDNEHYKRVERYAKEVQSLYFQIADHVARISSTQAFKAGIFTFKDYPVLNRMVDKLIESLRKSMLVVIRSGISKEWDNANENNDALVKYLSSKINLPEKKYKTRNLKALEAFQGRKINGLGLSERVWNYATQYKTELEQALDVGIADGRSAAQLSRDIREYLREPEKLFRRVRDKNGILKPSKNALKYNPGGGVYRSSYKNAMRLTRTEINQSYREADYLRWQQMDFVVGIEIRRSNHEYGCPVCESLKGKYPKDFKFIGWHPHCYSDDSFVLTNRGWRLFKDVQDSDKIFSLNPKTREPEWVGITDRQQYHINDKMVRFYNRTLDCLVTPDHEMVYINKSDGEIRRKLALEYRKGNGGFYRGCEWGGSYQKQIQIGSHTFDLGDFAEFMGYWLSDGSLIRNYQIKIAHQDGRESKEDIKECCARMGFDVGGTTGSVDVYSKDLNAYLKQFGLCETKYVPEEIKNADASIIQRFLDAFVKCDGHIKRAKPFMGNRGKMCIPNNNERIYFTTSNQMASDIGELILKIGKRPSYYIDNVRGKEQRFSNGIYTINQDLIRISECNGITATVFDKEFIDYHGDVYDLTLERNHIMYIRRNGKCFWGSNCRCHAIPILSTQKELLDSINDETPVQSNNEVKDMPNNFSKWMKGNEDRVVRAKTLPFFIQNNLQFVDSNTIKERSILELMEKAKSAETSVSSLSNSIAEKFGGYSTQVNFKSYDSIKRKANSDYNGNVNKIQDSVRTTIILPEKNIEKCLEYIIKNNNFIRVKIQTPDKFMGYSGTIANVKTNIGVIGEIQVNTAKIIYAKELPEVAKKIIGEKAWNDIRRQTGLQGGLGHKYYEEYRRLNKNIPEQAKRMIELDKLSNEYYKHFR